MTERPILIGGCFCGDIRYCVVGAPRFVVACHCTCCQLASASAFALAAVIPTTAFALVGRETPWGISRESAGIISTRFICPECATWTHSTTSRSSAWMTIRPSTLDERIWDPPHAEMFTRSALPWARLRLPLNYEGNLSNNDIETIAAYAASNINPGNALTHVSRAHVQN